MPLQSNTAANIEAILDDAETRVAAAGELLGQRLAAAAPRGRTRRKRFLETKVKVVTKRYKGAVVSKISTPLPTLQIEYGHLLNGRFIPPRPWFWPTIDNSENDVRGIMEAPKP